MKERVYIASSWKNRDRVRAVATVLREAGHEVYDFTEKQRAPRAAGLSEALVSSSLSPGFEPEIPPERFPVQFDPAKSTYREYLTEHPEWRRAVEDNRRALDWCSTVVMLLPCGNDAHADAFYGLGLGRRLVIAGQSRAGERTPTHLWADRILDFDHQVAPYLDEVSRLPRCMVTKVFETRCRREKHANQDHEFVMLPPIRRSSLPPPVTRQLRTPPEVPPAVATFAMGDAVHRKGHASPVGVVSRIVRLPFDASLPEDRRDWPFVVFDDGTAATVNPLYLEPVSDITPGTAAPSSVVTADFARGWNAGIAAAAEQCEAEREWYDEQADLDSPQFVIGARSAIKDCTAHIRELVKKEQR